MKTALNFTIFLFVICAFAAAQDSRRSSSEEQNAKLAVDKMIAAWGHNDADALERLWAGDYTFTNPSGIALTKSQRLGMLRSGRVKVEDYSVDNEKVRIYGQTAVVTYRSVVRRQAEGREIASEQHLVLTVLVKQDGVWRAVAQQSTPVLVTPNREPNTKADK